MVDPTSDAPGDLAATFRHKANYMKTWKPASTPSNRDRLELYALHKQAVSGDAPANLPTSTAGERAKYNAWKSKSGMSSQEAMRLYVQESDRQVRVYGLAAPNGTDGGALANASAAGAAVAASAAAAPPSSPAVQPRGLAAIPLLCAAASESRTAYLRRLSQMQPQQAWWQRQEPLCASSPSSLTALPETVLIRFAGFLEHLSLAWDGPVLPQPVLQSFLWPLHNVCLALWMGLILVSTLWMALSDVAQTMVWGSRRTGHYLPALWKDCIMFCGASRATLTEAHQPLSVRLVGLALMPASMIISVASRLPVVWASMVYVAVFLVTWWYWFLVLPWLGGCMMAMAVVTGNCFALIELAGV